MTTIHQKALHRDSIDEQSDFALTYPASRRPSSINKQYVEDTGKDIVSREGREFEGSQSWNVVNFPDVLTAYESGRRNEHILCIVLRDRSNMMYPSYEMKLQETNATILLARKLSLGRGGSYHFFDMTGGQSGKQLSKKSDNYLGKLRTVKSGRTEFVLVSDKSDQLELAGFLFDRLEVQPKSAEGVDGVISPRKLSVVIPFLNSEGHTVFNNVRNDQKDQSLTSALRGGPTDLRSDTVHTFITKSPILVNGNFRLNFRGRVTVPSIKNFQLIPDDELNNIILQFGKVDDDSFHLDFKAPFNALQAFAAALSQFSM